MLNPYTTFLVDGDDTLWKNNAYFELAGVQCRQYCIDQKEENRASVEKRFRELEMEEVRSAAHYGAEEHLAFLEKFMRIQGRELSPGQQEYLRKILEKINNPEIYEHAIPLLETLHKHGRIYLHSRDMADSIEGKLSHMPSIAARLSGHFTSRKSPRDLGEVIDLIDAKLDEILVIGDSLQHDILPADELGIASIYYQNDETWLPESAFPVPRTTILTKDFSEIS